MPTLCVQGIGRGAFNHNSLHPRAPVRPGSFQSRPVCRPVLLAPPACRSPRRQRARLVTKNFKHSEEEAPVVRPKVHRHPVTEDPFAGATPAETATQEVLFNAGPTAAAAAAPPKEFGYLGAMGQLGQQVALLLTRPRALLRGLIRNSAYGLPLLLAYLARQPLMSFWTFYCSSLDSHPLLTKIATGVVGTIIGDYIAQRLSHQTEVQSAQLRSEPSPAFTFDIVRVSRLVVYGALVGTPIGHAWFQLLDSRVMPEAMTSAQAVLTKMSLDQLLMCPMATALFFVVMRCWEGHPQDALTYMRTKLGPTLKANYVLWPLAHIINFAFVPPAQRILYCNAIGIAWTVILSSILNSKTPPAATAQTVAGGPPPPSGGGGAPVPSSGSSRGPGESGATPKRPRHGPPAAPDMIPGFAAASSSGGSGGFELGQLQTLVGRRAQAPGVAAMAYMRRVRKDEPGKDA